MIGNKPQEKYKMSSQKPEINLLSQKSFEDTTIGRIMAWILTSFRIIVIITEIIVMVAFISRFWLDSKNTDLDEQIQNKQAIIAASSTFEQEFKNTQARLKALSEIISQPYKPSQVFEVITKQITPDSILTSVNFQNGQAEIAGTSPNEKDIQKEIFL